MRRAVDELVNRWLTRMPEARTAFHNDAEYHFQITFLRRTLAAFDMVMEDEGIPEATRLRIVRTLVHGAPSEADALARMDEMKKRADELSKVSPFSSIVPPWDAK